jgi:hypothetical protein
MPIITLQALMRIARKIEQIIVYTSGVPTRQK